MSKYTVTDANDETLGTIRRSSAPGHSDIINVRWTAYDERGDSLASFSRRSDAVEAVCDAADYGRYLIEHPVSISR